MKRRKVTHFYATLHIKRACIYLVKVRFNLLINSIALQSQTSSMQLEIVKVNQEQ
jgi:hypothetical protein